jgi:hypothetical protein
MVDHQEDRPAVGDPRARPIGRLLDRSVQAIAGQGPQAMRDRGDSFPVNDLGETRSTLHRATTASSRRSNDATGMSDLTDDPPAQRLLKCSSILLQASLFLLESESLSLEVPSNCPLVLDQPCQVPILKLNRLAVVFVLLDMIAKLLKQPHQSRVFLALDPQPGFALILCFAFQFIPHHLKSDPMAELMEERPDPAGRFLVCRHESAELIGKIGSDCKHAESVLVVKLEAGKLGSDLLPEPPDTEILNLFDYVVEQDHPSVAQFRSPGLKIMTNSLVSMIAVDMKEVDLAVAETRGSFVEGHFQKGGKVAVSRVVMLSQLAEHLRPVDPVVGVSFPGVHRNGAGGKAERLDRLAEAAVRRPPKGAELHEHPWTKHRNDPHGEGNMFNPV